MPDKKKVGKVRPPEDSAKGNKKKKKEKEKAENKPEKKPEEKKVEDKYEVKPRKSKAPDIYKNDKASEKSFSFYFDDFYKKDHTTVKLYWKPPKSLQDLTGSYGETHFGVMKGFIKTDLAIQVQNSWGNMSTFAQSFFGSLGFNVDSWIGTGQEVILKTTDALNKHTSLNATSDRVNEYANAKLVHFTDYVKKFQGTDVNFPNNVDVMFISDSYGHDPRKDARKLLKFIMGGFSEGAEVRDPIELTETVPGTEKSKEDLAQEEKNRQESFVQKGVNLFKDGLATGADIVFGSEVFKKSYAFITSPGHYEYSTDFEFRNPFLSLPGTLTMIIGDTGGRLENSGSKSGVIIRNLLVDSAEITVSKSITQAGYPLYVNVSLALSPTAFFSAGNLDVMLGGDGKWDRFGDIEKDSGDNKLNGEEEKIARAHYGDGQLPHEIKNEMKRVYNIILEIEKLSVSTYVDKFKGKEGPNGEFYLDKYSCAVVSGLQPNLGHFLDKGTGVIDQKNNKEATNDTSAENLSNQLSSNRHYDSNIAMYHACVPRLRKINCGNGNSVDVIQESGQGSVYDIMMHYRRIYSELEPKYKEANQKMEDSLKYAKEKQEGNSYV
jgi:hypothetical protein